MRFSIEVVEPAPSWMRPGKTTFWSLQGAARYVANSTQPGVSYRLVGPVTPAREHDRALVVVRYAAAATLYCRPADWDAVVEISVMLLADEAKKGAT